MSQSANSKDRFIPVLLFSLPALAVVACLITLYLIIKHPDQEISVQKVTVIRDGDTVHQHVVNSVTPPLK